MCKYELIDLNDYTYSGEGGQGVAYTHRSDPRLAKLFNPGFEVDVALEEFKMAEAAYDLGIPTPKPLRLITDGERVGTEYELIRDKRSLCRIISEEPGRLEEISLDFAGACRELHSRRADTSRIPSMKGRMQEFLSREGVVPDSLSEKMATFLETVPDTPCCLHGDMQIGNIITDGRRTLWIDIGQFAYGAPEWDLALCMRVCDIKDPARADKLFHLTPGQMRRHWDIFIRAYYGLSSDEEVARCERRLMPYSAIKVAYMYHITFHAPMGEDLVRFLSGMF